VSSVHDNDDLHIPCSQLYFSVLVREHEATTGLALAQILPIATTKQYVVSCLRSFEVQKILFEVQNYKEKCDFSRIFTFLT
jgi:hypothetical protein